MRSTPKRSLVTHFIMRTLLWRSSVAPLPVYPPLSESSLATAPVDTCGKALQDQHHPVPTHPESPGRRSLHDFETAGSAHLPAPAKASAIPTNGLLLQVRQSLQPTTGTARASREWRAAPRPPHAGAAPPPACGFARSQRRRL